MTNLRVIGGGSAPDRLHRLRSAIDALAAEIDAESKVTGVVVIVTRDGKPTLQFFDYDRPVELIAELFGAATDIHNKRGFRD
jgi:hypothetical protein